MASTIIGDGANYTLYPPSEALINPREAYQRIIVDNGAISIDHASHGANENDSHLFLKGTLQAHESYVKITNDANVEKLRIDNTGKIHAPGGVTCPEITTVTTATSGNTASITALTGTVTTLTTETTQNTNQLMSATAAATNGTLVLRHNVNGTHFAKITSDIVEIGTAQALYGDANIQYIPQDNGGNNIAGSIYRFGSNHEEFDFTGSGEGIELIGRAPSNPAEQRNSVQMFPQESAPTLQMVCTKTAGVPWVRLNNENDVETIEISEFGLAQRLSSSTQFNISPGSIYTGTLSPGFSESVFTLSGNWTAADGSLTFILKSNTDIEGHYIKCIEVSVDESSSNSYIQSQVYVDRFSKHVKNHPTDSELRVVLKYEFLGGETSIPSGTVLRLLILNNKIITA